ncbi:hypothetical protein RSW36_26605, partial [Escherichia coli]|uniref:hypothetical protein n=1 Tax=Escherichia coli TaxID=562 RepID=UPI0028DE24C4
VTATNLPWTITAPDTTHVTISSAGFNTPIGNCSPNQLNANWMNNSSASTMSFINQPVGFDCLVTVSLKVPGVTVEPI